MRWLTFGVLAILVVSLQVTIAPRLTWFGARPDWVLVLVVFYALHAPTDRAILAGWLAGALADVMSIERFGLLSISYGLAALAVCAVREALFTRHPLTHLSVTLVAGLLVQGIWTAFRLATGTGSAPFWPLLWGWVYTALWAVPMHWALLKTPRLLGLRAGLASRRSRGHRV